MHPRLVRCYQASTVVIESLLKQCVHVGAARRWEGGGTANPAINLHRRTITCTDVQSPVRSQLHTSASKTLSIAHLFCLHRDPGVTLLARRDETEIPAKPEAAQTTSRPSYTERSPQPACKTHSKMRCAAACWHDLSTHGTKTTQPNHTALLMYNTSARTSTGQKCRSWHKKEGLAHPSPACLLW